MAASSCSGNEKRLRNDACRSGFLRLALLCVLPVLALCAPASSADLGRTSPAPESLRQARNARLERIPATWTATYDFSESGRSAADDPENSRPILIEEFTSASGRYCYSMGIALDRIRDEYGRDEILTISYHNDALETPFGLTRADYYDVVEVPQVILDSQRQEKETGGHALEEGEAGITATCNSLKTKIAKERTRIGSAAPFTFSFVGQYAPSSPLFDVKVTARAGYSGVVHLVAVVVEDGIPYPCSNGQTMLNSVARGLLGDEAFQLSEPGSVTFRVSYDGSVPCTNASNQSVILFVQDLQADEILGGAALPYGRIYRDTAVDRNWSLYQ